MPRASTGTLKIQVDQLFTDPQIGGIVVMLDEIRERAIARRDAFGAESWTASPETG